MLAMWAKDEKQMKPLQHTVNILGAAEKTFFTLNIHPSRNILPLPPTAPVPAPTASSSDNIENEDPNTKLGRLRSYLSNSTTMFPILFTEIKHLYNICKCLNRLTKTDIEDVGLALGLHYPTLKNMERIPHDMVEAWLLQKDSVSVTQHPTKEKLIQALLSSDLCGTAELVKKEHITTTSL